MKSVLLAPEAIDKASDRRATRLICVYSLALGAAGPHGEQSPEEVFPLGRFERHFRSARDVFPTFSELATFTRATLSTERGMFLGDASGALYLASVPRAGALLVVVLEFVGDVARTITVLQETCFRRDTLAIARDPVLAIVGRTLRDDTAVEPRFESDVHQVLLPGSGLESDLGRFDGDDRRHDRSLAMRLIYREDRPFRGDAGSARYPAELNRPAGSFCGHGRGVTVLIGAAEHVEWGVALTAMELVAASRRAREIRLDAVAVLGEAEEVSRVGTEDRGVSSRRMRLGELARRLADLELEQSFGVEAYRDALRLPEIVLESYRESLAQGLALQTAAETTARMLARLKNVVEARAAELLTEEARLEELRRARRGLALGYLTVVGGTLGLILAFLGANAREVEAGRSVFDLGTYGWWYGAFVAATVLALALYGVHWVWHRRKE